MVNCQCQKVKIFHNWQSKGHTVSREAKSLIVFFLTLVNFCMPRLIHTPMRSIILFTNKVISTQIKVGKKLVWTIGLNP